MRRFIIVFLCWLLFSLLPIVLIDISAFKPLLTTGQYIGYIMLCFASGGFSATVGMWLDDLID